MRRQRTLITLVSLLVVGSLTALGAQESMSMEGELAWVDADAMTFATTDTDGTEHEFAYTDETEVTGAEEGVQGLATKTGQRVAVEYESDAEVDGRPVATTISILD